MAMAVLSKEEINLKRLLSCSETLANNIKLKEGEINWRLEKFVIALQKHIVDLGKHESKPNSETMLEYTRRIEFLRHTIDVEKETCAYRKAVQQIAPPLVNTDKINSKPSKVREIHLKSKTRHEIEARKELFGSGLKHRKLESDDSLDEVLQHHQNMQEKIANEMIEMAQNLKQNSLLANNILKKDNKALDSASTLADSNLVKLKHESERLQEITNRPCSLWVWLMLACVCIVFITMIIFIRFVPKR